MDSPAETLKDGDNVFQYEYDPSHTIQDYLKRDIEFLIIQLIIEAHEAGLDSLTMSNLIQMNYWDTDQITYEVYENFDEHWSIETLILDTVVFIIDDARLGKVDEIILHNFSRAVERVAENAVNAGHNANGRSAESNSELRELSMRYSSMINSLFFLNDRYKQQKKEAFDNSGIENYRERLDQAEIISEPMELYERSPLIDLVMEVPDLIDVGFTINNGKLLEIKGEISKYLNDFVQGTEPKHNFHSLEEKKTFSKQMENFVTYLKALPLIEKTVNIPFSILENEQFDAMKMLSYLKENGALQFKWNQSDCWHVALKNLPISVDSLLGINVSSEEIPLTGKELKYNLSFSSQPCCLTLTSTDGQVTKIAVQGQVQKEVLRVIFKNPDHIFDDWSLYDISEILGSEDVSSKAVANAIYQFNQKVQRSLPHVKRLFEHNYSSARLNPKYVQRS